jgi:LuxR family maltose regulon positive regulatory protein
VPGALLTTKLHPPPKRDQRVIRERLLDALNEGSTRRLTLVSAPAGYGKTTLLSNWFERTGKDVAWLSLDEADNDLRRFLAYLVATLQRVDATLREAAIGVEDSRAALTFILNDIAQNEADLILVLDDYHVITSAAVHEVVSFLLEHTPPQFHLLLGSRSDPPLALARWRVRGELCELRAHDLRFHAGEAQSFLEDVMHLTLSYEDAAELTRRTEGWIAGLQLAALSLRGREKVAGFIETFTGTDRFVLDYLTEEVLTRQPDEMQNFLVLTSVLERFCGPLCDAVTGLKASQARLESLERDNLFIIPLDNQRHWYRYQAFFGDLLAHRLNEARPDLPPQLHDKASRWFEENGHPADALRHALLAGDFGRAAALITAHPQGHEVRRELTAFLQAPASTAPLEGLLEQALAQGISLERSRLFHAFEESEAIVATVSARSGGALEPLSERELEVLRLVAAGFANKEIARRLDISLNTVKTHTKNINSKLGAKSRTQASVRARELGLL